MTKKQEFIKNYLQTKSVRKTCQIMQIPEVTAYKMLKNGLREEIKKINDNLYQSALQDLQATAEKVNNELIQIITDKDTNKQVKINAIKAFYDILSQSKLIDLQQELENFNLEK